jgi:KDO2-lipid IV(A) lauroyltransferase
MGSRILYYALIWPLSKLPYSLLYLLADLIYPFLRYYPGYRLKLVKKHVRDSFPGLTPQKHNAIVSGFYHHLSDIIVESLKNFSLEAKDAGKRIICRDASLLDRFADEGRNVILVAGHYGNWELYAIAGASHLKGRLVGIYKKLKDPFFDRKVASSRGKYGCNLVSTKQIGRAFTDFQAPFLVALIMDQAPVSSSKSYWMDFLGQDTAVKFGAEKYAKEFDMPVVYGCIHKVRRGYYEVTYELVEEFPRISSYGFITEKMTRLLERDIIDKPEHWLWTHKRWKRRRDDGT